VWTACSDPGLPRQAGNLPGESKNAPRTLSAEPGSEQAACEVLI